MTPERRERLKAIAGLPLPASYELDQLCRDLIDARAALSEVLCELEAAEQRAGEIATIADRQEAPNDA